MKLIKPAVYNNLIKPVYEGSLEKGGGWVKLGDLEIAAENFGMEPQEVCVFLEGMGKANGGLHYSFDGEEIFEVREKIESKEVFIPEGDADQFLFLASSGVRGFREKEKGGYEYEWKKS